MVRLDLSSTPSSSQEQPSSTSSSSSSSISSSTSQETFLNPHPNPSNSSFSSINNSDTDGRNVGYSSTFSRRWNALNTTVRTINDPNSKTNNTVVRGGPSQIQVPGMCIIVDRNTDMRVQESEMRRRFLQEHWKGHDLADQTGTIHFTYERNEQEQFKMDYLQKHIYKHQEQTNYLCNSYGKLAGQRLMTAIHNYNNHRVELFHLFGYGEKLKKKIPAPMPSDDMCLIVMYGGWVSSLSPVNIRSTSSPSSPSQPSKGMRGIQKIKWLPQTAIAIVCKFLGIKGKQQRIELLAQGKQSNKYADAILRTGRKMTVNDWETLELDTYVAKEERIRRARRLGQAMKPGFNRNRNVDAITNFYEKYRRTNTSNKGTYEGLEEYTNMRIAQLRE